MLMVLVSRGLLELSLVQLPLREQVDVVRLLKKDAAMLPPTFAYRMLCLVTLTAV